MANHLQEMGVEVYRGTGKTGLVGLLKNGDGPTIALRSDMDALPMQEFTDLPYRSRTDNRFHGCGHDGHIAIDLPWSNGQAEGQIHLLKTIKRAMYGKAGPELLRARMMPIKMADTNVTRQRRKRSGDLISAPTRDWRRIASTSAGMNRPPPGPQVSRRSAYGPQARLIG